MSVPGRGEVPEPIKPRQNGPADHDDVGVGRSIAEAVNEYLQVEGMGELRQLATIESCWDGLVGSTVAAHVRPITLHDGELTVSVDQPAWATELRFLSEQIINELAERCGHGVVLRLKVHVRG